MRTRHTDLASGHDVASRLSAIVRIGYSPMASTEEYLMSRAQLQASSGKLFDSTPEHFFEHELPAFLAAHRQAARAIGGRYGFIVGARQWLVDLDYGQVDGDRYSDVVDERDDIDVILMVDARELACVLRGSHDRAPSLTLARGDTSTLKRLSEFLSGES